MSYRAQLPALHKVMQAGWHRARHCRVTLRNTALCVAVLGDKLSTVSTLYTREGDKVAPPGWGSGDARRPCVGVLGRKNTHETCEQTTLTRTRGKNTHEVGDKTTLTGTTHA